MLRASAFRTRHRNSGRQHDGKRFPKHLRWLRTLPCIIDGMYDHACEGKMEAAHVDHAGGKGVSLKVADYKAIPACSAAHSAIHRGARTFEIKYGLNLVEAAKEYAKRSPHKHEWEATL